MPGERGPEYGQMEEKLHEAKKTHAEKLKEIDISDPQVRGQLVKDSTEKVERSLSHLQEIMRHADERIRKLGFQHATELLKTFFDLHQQEKAHFVEGVKKLNNALDLLVTELQAHRKVETKEGSSLLQTASERKESGEKAIVHEVWMNLSREEKKTVLVEALEEKRLSPSQERRMKQLELLKTAYESLKRGYEQGEPHIFAKLATKLKGGEGYVKDFVSKVDQFIAKNIPRMTVTIARYPELTFDELFEVYKIASALDSFRKIGIDLKESSSDEDLREQKLQLISWQRRLGDYEKARELCKEELRSEFEQILQTHFKPQEREIHISGESRKITVIPEVFQESMERIFKKVKNAELLDALKKEAEKSGKVFDEQEAMKKTEEYIDTLMYLDYEHREDIAVAEKIHELNLSSSWSKEKKGFWNEYKDSFGIGKADLADESWDTIIDEVAINAPLIIVSGGIASAARAVGGKALSYGARAAIGAVVINRIAGVVGKAGRAGKLLTEIPGLAFEGMMFELTHAGIQGEWLFHSPEWAQKILWSSLTLGAFKGAGKVGDALVGKEGLLKSHTSRIGNEFVRKGIEELMVKGHLEVAAMLMMGAIQQGVYQGDIDEFVDHFGEELFHAYIAVGSLKISGKVVKTASEKILAGAEKGAEKGKEKIPSLIEAEDPQTGFRRKAALLSDRGVREMNEKIPGNKLLCFFDFNHMSVMNKLGLAEKVDQFIKAIPQIAKDVFQGTVYECFRTGGDEFSLVLQKTARVGEQVKLLFSRLETKKRELFADHNVLQEGKRIAGFRTAMRRIRGEYKEECTRQKAAFTLEGFAKWLKGQGADEALYVWIEKGMPIERATALLQRDLAKRRISEGKEKEAPEPLTASSSTVEVGDRPTPETVLQGLGQADHTVHEAKRAGIPSIIEAEPLKADTPLNENYRYEREQWRQREVEFETMREQLAKATGKEKETIQKRMEQLVLADPVLRDIIRFEVAKDENAKKILNVRGQTLMTRITIDIPDFGAVNNTRGYAYGDAVCKVMIEKIQDSLKQQSIKPFIFRRGGGQFFVFVKCIIPSDSIRKIEGVANESIREKLQNSEMITEALERHVLDAEMRGVELPQEVRFGKVDMSSKEITVNPESLLQNLIE